MPLVTLLTLFWLYFENEGNGKIANHAYYTFWYVIPTLPMFIAFPWLLGRFGFWSVIVASVMLTVLCFVLFARVLVFFDIDLLA